MRLIAIIFVLFFTAIQTISGVFGIQPTQVLRANPNEIHQTMDGFGTSSAWWAQTIEESSLADQIAEDLYNKDTGLGLSVFRYNIGAGEKDNPDSKIAVENRKTESFYVWDNDTGTYRFDFTRDLNARRVLDAAVKNGATKIVLFCNSPHFSMTKNGLASGNLTEQTCNLPVENYGDFVNYVLTIADHFVSLGYPVYAVSPINEPQWDWGTGWISQEGCHYSPEEAIRLLEAFAKEMMQRNSPYKLSGPESGQMNEAFAEYERLFFESPVLSAFCDTYSGHSYWLDGLTEEKEKTAQRLQTAYGTAKKYEMSEWCELPLTLDSTTIESGLRMANVMYEDLSIMDAVSWQSWTAVNGDGLMDLTDGSLTYYKRYYIMKQFSAFIPEGSVRIGVLDSLFDQSELKTIAFANGGDIVFVIINNTQQAKSIKLQGVYKSMQIHVTDAELNCECTYWGRFRSAVTLTPNSVTTISLTTGIC